MNPPNPGFGVPRVPGVSSPFGPAGPNPPRRGDLAGTVPGVGMMLVNQVPVPGPGGQQALPMPNLPVPGGFPNPFTGGPPMGGPPMGGMPMGGPPMGGMPMGGPPMGGMPMGGPPMGGMPMGGMMPSYTPGGAPFAPGFRPAPGLSGPGAVPPGGAAGPNTLIGGMLPPSARVPGISPFGGAAPGPMGGTYPSATGIPMGMPVIPGLPTPPPGNPGGNPLGSQIPPVAPPGNYAAAPQSGPIEGLMAETGPRQQAVAEPHLSQVAASLLEHSQVHDLLGDTLIPLVERADFRPQLMGMALSLLQSQEIQGCLRDLATGRRDHKQFVDLFGRRLRAAAELKGWLDPPQRP